MYTYYVRKVEGVKPVDPALKVETPPAKLNEFQAPLA